LVWISKPKSAKRLLGFLNLKFEGGRGLKVGNIKGWFRFLNKKAEIKGFLKGDLGNIKAKE
jgi:hypothetical protein